jgi:hypothetical protein
MMLMSKFASEDAEALSRLIVPNPRRTIIRDYSNGKGFVGQTAVDCLGIMTKDGVISCP